MSSRLQNVCQVFRLFVIDLPEHALRQDFREADDGVERRAQLVRHVGEELTLVLARHLELPALVLDLAEQPRVLYRDDRLVGKRFEQRDLPVGERADVIAADSDRADALSPQIIGATITARVPTASQDRRVPAGTSWPFRTSGRC